MGPVTRGGMAIVSRFGPLGLVLLDVVRQLPDELILPGLSLVAGVIATPLVAFVVGWSVIAYFLYKATDLFLPDIVASRGFRSVFTLSTLGHAVVFAEVISPDFEPLRIFAYVGLLASLSAVSFVVYLRFVAGWQLFDPGGPTVALLDAFVPFENMHEELRKSRSYEGGLRSLAFVIWVGAVGAVFEIACMIVGVVGASLADAAPLPDVLALAIVAADFGVLPAVDDAVDIETRAYAALESATRNLKGTVLMMFSTVGGLSAALIVSMAFQLFPVFSSVVRHAVPVAPLVAWNYFGITLLLPTIAGYLFWYWIRQFERVEGFLDLWVHKPKGVAGPTRPYGLTLPPMLAYVSLVVFVELSSRSNALPRVVFAFAWPTFLVVFVVCVRLTRMNRTQIPANEDGAIAIALCIQYAGIWLGGDAPKIVDGQFVPVLLSPLLLVGLISIVVATYLPDMLRYEQERDDVGRYATVFYLTGFGIVTGILARVANEKTATMLAVLTGVCFVGALAIATAKRFETEFLR